MSLQPGADLISIAKRLVPWAGPAPLLLHSMGRLTRSPQQSDLEPQQSDLQSQGAEIPMQDWNLLLDAVKDRLRQVVGAPSEPLPAAGFTPDASRRVQSSVLECIDALDLLQMSLIHALGRRQFLEDAFRTAQAELLETRADLAGTQAGERQARHQSLHDGLTLLPNRRYFLEQLERAVACCDPGNPHLAILYLDLDGFKAINDLHGHEVGDELLRIVAARLGRVVRSEDMVSRLGGDEFACLRVGFGDRELLRQLAEKLFDAVAAPLQMGTLQLTVQPSVGIAIYPADGDRASALLRSADAAMVAAKRLRSRYAFCEPASASSGTSAH